MHVEDTGQLCGVSSLLLPLPRFKGWAFMAGAFIFELPYKLQTVIFILNIHFQNQPDVTIAFICWLGLKQFLWKP